MTDSIEPIEQMKQSIAEGKHWYLALLECISLWTMAEETYCDRQYRYLIQGQAFDWFLLAERLCQEISDVIPQDEREALLFGKPPVKLSREEFKGLIGNEKYQAHLNYFYGVVVEQALHLAVETEIEKEMHGAIRPDDPRNDVFQRVYGLDVSRLLEKFRQEQGLPPGDSVNLTQLQEFTYWLFKYRINNCDSSRLASDTKKALKQLTKLEGKP